MWNRSVLGFVLILWYTQAGTPNAMPESGLEKAAAASAVIAGSDSPASLSNGQQQQQTDLESRLKRITDTIHRVRGPDSESSDGRKSERLVVADRSAQQAGASQSPYMMRQDELGSSGDGAIGDDDEGDDPNGELGSGDPDEGIEGPMGAPEPPRSGFAPMPVSPATEGVYPVDVDEHTTKKFAHTPSTRRPVAGRPTTGPTRKPYIESEHRHPTTKRPHSSSSSCRTLCAVSFWFRLFVSLCISIAVSKFSSSR